MRCRMLLIRLSRRMGPNGFGMSWPTIFPTQPKSSIGFMPDNICRMRPRRCVDQPAARRTDDLFAGNIQRSTQELDAAGLSTHSHYFHTHKRRMRYQEFREEGLPIGSGTVESSVKQFKARLAGPGMRWKRASAQDMLIIESVKKSV